MFSCLHTAVAFDATFFSLSPGDNIKRDATKRRVGNGSRSPDDQGAKRVVHRESGHVSSCLARRLCSWLHPVPFQDFVPLQNVCNALRHNPSK